jgi:hypothetical protein
MNKEGKSQIHLREEMFVNHENWELLKKMFRVTGDDIDEFVLEARLIRIDKKTRTANPCSR